MENLYKTLRVFGGEVRFRYSESEVELMDKIETACMNYERVEAENHNLRLIIESKDTEIELRKLGQLL